MNADASEPPVQSGSTDTPSKQSEADKAFDALRRHFSGGRNLADIVKSQKAGVEILRRIQSKLSVGMSYLQYSQALVDTKPDFDTAMQGIPPVNKVRGKLEESFDAHLCALELWRLQIQSQGRVEIPASKVERFRRYGVTMTDRKVTPESARVQLWQHAEGELSVAVDLIKEAETHQ